MLVGLLLAGGRSRRMGGGDKFLREIGGVRLLDRTLSRLDTQVDQTLVSVNGNIGSVTNLGRITVEDPPGLEGRGPLSGILAGLRWLATDHGEDALLLSVPADTPFLPFDLADRLGEARAATSAEIAIAASCGRLHYAAALWPAALADDLETWLRDSPDFAIRAFLGTRATAVAEFPAVHDPFLNVNTPEDLARAHLIAESFSP